MEDNQIDVSDSQMANAALLFAEGLRSGDMSSFMRSGIFTPFTQNQNLLNISNNGNGIPVPDYERIKKALEDSVENAKTLQGYSEYMATWDTLYQKTLRLYDDILAFDLSWACTNIKDPSEWESEDYKADLRRVHKFLDCFDYKREFRKAVYHMNRTDFYPCWFRDSYGTIDDTELDDSDAGTATRKLPQFALQQMPSNQCIITGYNPKTLLWDFNMAYFLNPSVDINLFDPVFKRKFREVYSGKSEWNYNPAAQFDDRDGTYANYIQMSPDDGMWTFKFNEATFDTAPPFSNLMKVMFPNTRVAELQMDKNFNSAIGVLFGELKNLTKTQGGDKPDQFAISPGAVGKFMSLVKSALQDTFREVAVPLENTQMWQGDEKNPDMVGTSLENSAGQGSFASSIIYSKGKKGQAEFLNGLIADYNIMKKLYSQFNSFLNFFVNKKTRKYKFSFMFDGCSFPFEREYRRKQIQELADRGLTLPVQAWASVYGVEPQNFDRMLDEAVHGGMSKKLMLLLNANTSKDGGSVGNPVKDDTQLKDTGSVSRDYQ